MMYGDSAWSTTAKIIFVGFSETAYFDSMKKQAMGWLPRSGLVLQMERNTLQDITLLQHCRCKKLSRHRLIGHCLSSKVWVGTNNHKDNETAMICNNCSAPIPATAVFYRNPLSITAQRKSINTMRPAFRSHGIIHRKTVVVTGNQC